VASLLRRRGVRKGDRVGILATNCPAWVEVFLGIHKAGAVAVPLNYRLAPAECDRMLQDAGVAVLLAGPELSIPPTFGGATVAFGPGYEAELAAASHEDLDGGAEPDDLAVIVYTSGTTGLPKGVMWSHRTLLSSAQANPFPAAVAGGARVLVCAPLFAGGGVLMACNALAIGATLVIAHFTPEGVLRTLADADIEFTGLVPTMISCLVDAAPPGWRAPALRRLYYGAGSMHPQLFARAQRLFGCEFQQAYGMTETCIFGTRLDPADHRLDRPERLTSAGMPMPQVSLMIVDESGAPVPAGTPGEILIRSPGNMLGYWQRPEESRRALAGGWYHTNDIGRLDDEGYFYWLDRKDDMVKSGGLNVSPAEVEDILLTHPGVEEAAVVGLPDDHWGQRVAAIVRKRATTPLTADALTTFCRDRLAGYKCPRTIIFTDVPLPRNALGKVTRHALRAQCSGLRAE
jgi:acyl-CoA synthetase (AMP-forming)/AMP-acid ligase II